jgi:anti-sigma B factor antagonist
VTILDVATADRGDGLVHVELSGELDLSSVGKLEEELGKTSPNVLVVDLTALTFLDSTGLRCLVRADEKARGEGRRMVVVRGPEQIQKVFSITRLDERLEMVDDASAVESGH